MKISRYLASPQEPEEGGHFLGFTIIEGKEGTTPASTPVDRAGAARSFEGTGEGLMAGWGAPGRGAEFESGETVWLGRGGGWQAGLGRRGARLAGEGEGVWSREIAGGFVVRAKISSGEDKVGGVFEWVKSAICRDNKIKDNWALQESCNKTFIQIVKMETVGKCITSK